MNKVKVVSIIIYSCCYVFIFMFVLHQLRLTISKPIYYLIHIFQNSNLISIFWMSVVMCQESVIISCDKFQEHISHQMHNLKSQSITSQLQLQMELIMACNDNCNLIQNWKNKIKPRCDLIIIRCAL